VPPLVRTLRTLLSTPHGTDAPPPFALICTTLRQPSTLEAFLAAAADAGLHAADRTAALFPTRQFHHQAFVQRDAVRVHLLRRA
jgi:hypothetical protein